MYEKGASIAMASNGSYCPRNLSILSSDDMVRYAVVSRNCVNLTTTSRLVDEVDQKQVIPKISKDEMTASTSDSDNLLNANIIQSKLVTVSERNILVICATKGIFFFDETGENLIYFHNFREIRANQTEETAYSRGVAVYQKNTVAIGTSAGSILIFDVSPRGDNITQIDELREKNLRCGIADLITAGNYIIAADTNGDIFAWYGKGQKQPHFIFSILSNKNACTCLGVWDSCLIACYGNGLISIYDIENDGQKLIDISAHARWISCLDVSRDYFVTVSEDSFFRVWQIGCVNGRLKVNIIHAELVVDSQITGVQFNNGPEQICLSCYDKNEIFVYNSL